MSIFRGPAISLLLAAAVSCGTGGDPGVRGVNADPGARAVNQLAISGNACGPAAAINSLRFGDSRWRNALASLGDGSDRQQLHTLIRRHAMRPSPHLGGRPRWGRNGINLVDLTDVFNEITSPHHLPPVRNQVFFANNTIESPPAQLARIHRHLGKSLDHGLPPVLSIRRFARRDGEWVVIDAHFVTVTEIPRRLPRNAESFTVRYIDPWGAHHHQGELHIDSSITGFPEARFPNANVGKNRIRPGETSVLVASAMIGCF